MGETSTLSVRDVFAFIRLAVEIDIKEDIVSLVDSMSGINPMSEREAGISLLWSIIGKCAATEHEHHVWEFIGKLLGKTADEVGDMAMLDMIDALSEQGSMKEWLDFFKSAAAYLKRN